MEVKVKEPQSQDTPLVKGQSSDEKKVAPKTYSEAEHLKAVSDEKTVSGRLKTQLADITKERDTLKAQAAEATSAVEQTNAKLAELESDLETLTDENASAAEIAKIKKRLVATEEQLKKDFKTKQDALDELKRTTESERETFAATVAEAQAMRFHADVFEVAEEYEGGNSERLTAICDTIRESTGKTMSREGIKKVADTLWTKKASAEGNEPAILNDSGVTSGGSGKLTAERIEKMSAEEYANHPETKARYK